jgi:hypothetical protein
MAGPAAVAAVVLAVVVAGRIECTAEAAGQALEETVHTGQYIAAADHTEHHTTGCCTDNCTGLLAAGGGAGAGGAAVAAPGSAAVVALHTGGHTHTVLEVGPAKHTQEQVQVQVQVQSRQEGGTHHC